MLLGARQFFERRGAPPPALPYDAEVEWLESTGTQWIDTGLPISQNLRIVIRTMLTMLENPSMPVGANSGRRWFGFGMYGSLYFRIGTCSVLSDYMYGEYSIKLSLDTLWHTVTLDSTEGLHNAYGDIDGLGRRVATSGSASGINLYLFGCNGTAGPAKCRISGASFVNTITGDVLEDFTPVRFTNEQGVREGAMYDRVSGALFRNAGTGDFVIGPDKS